MAVYAIGDIQGCLAPLQELLDRLDFRPERDRLWFTGDLVNRGPQSAAVLRLVMSFGEAAVSVLGNHDLHLLAVAEGFGPELDKDTLDDVLDAPDRDALLHWLRHRPLLHHDPALGYTLTHAGLPPQWDLATARQCAQEVESVLRGAHYRDFLRQMYGNQPDRWDPALRGMERLRFITNAFTRLRYCDSQGRLDLAHKGKPGTQPAGLMPWYQVPGRKNRDLRILFGHWSTLGLSDYPGVYALDTGCLWGGKLSAMRLDGEQEIIQIDCPATRRPGY